MKTFFFLALALILFSCQNHEQLFIIDDEYLAAFEEEQTHTEVRDFYLQLVGLFRLRPGMGTLGTSDDVKF